MDPNRKADALELHKAAKADRSDLILSLLKCGADLEKKNRVGRTPLHVAAYFGNPGVVATLLAAKANIEARTTKKSYTALHIAAEKGHIAELKLLLWKGADINAVTGEGWTALNLAVYVGRYDVVSSLLDRGADVHAKVTKYGWAVLHTAADRGDVPITLLLLKKGADIKAVTKDGVNALHCAARAGQEEVAQVLLDQKADVYSAVESSTYTALHLAAVKAHDAILTVLLKAGADTLAQTKDGWTALDLLVASEKENSVTSKSAIQSCRQQLQESVDRALIQIQFYGLVIGTAAAAASDEIDLHLLLDHKTNISTSYSDNGRLVLTIDNDSTTLTLLFTLRADVDATTTLGWLPLHLAVQRGREGIVKTLLDLGADVNAKVVGTDSTALMWAVVTNKGSIVKILLEHGADVSVESEGWPALHWAAYLGLSGMVQQLLAYGADIASTTRNQRRTALHLAAEINSGNTVRTLLDGGADPLARTRDGKTALDVTRKSHTPIRSILQKAMEEASHAKHMGGILASPSIRESAPPNLYKMRPSLLGVSDEIIPPELSRFIPELASERIRNVWTSPRQRPSPLYDTEKFFERMDNLLSQHAFCQLIQQARGAPLDSYGDKTFLYFGSVKFVCNNVTVTVHAGVDTTQNDNLISQNLLSLLGNPPKYSERLYEIPFSALPLEPVLDPALGFVGFPQAELFKLDPHAQHDAVLGYDFFNFQGKDLHRSAQKWHVIYEELAMARLQAGSSASGLKSPRAADNDDHSVQGLQGHQFHFYESIRVCRPRNPRPYVKVRVTFHTGRNRSSVSREIVRQLGCSGNELEISLAFHFISEDRKYVWEFDVVDEIGAELVVGSDWLSSAGQSTLAMWQIPPPIIRPVPTSRKGMFNNRDTGPSLTSNVARPASASPRIANVNNQVGQRKTSDDHQTSDLAVPESYDRPQSAPAQEKAENASTSLLGSLHSATN